MSSKRKHTCTNANRALVQRGPGGASGSFARSRVAAALALLLGLYASVFPGAGWSQPVPVPALDRPAFQSQDLDPYFAVARGAGSETGWEWIVAQGRAALAAQWENYLDAQIAAHVGAVNTQDHFNSVDEYRDYLLQEFQLQKQTARNDWELAAELSIQSQRDPFLRNLAASIRSQQGVQTRDQLLSAEDVLESNPNADPEIVKKIEEWRRDYEKSLDRGLADYGAAFSQLNQDHEQFIQEIAAREAEFERDRQEIKNRENRVRGGIQIAIREMEGYLHSTSLFWEDDCDNRNRCDKTPIGQQLQDLITNVQAGLDNDTPLSTLAQMINDYMIAEQQRAEQTREYWAVRREGRVNYTPFVEISPWGHGLRGDYSHHYGRRTDRHTDDYADIRSHMYGVIDFNAIAGNAQLNAVRDWRAGSSAAAISFLTTLHHADIEITAIHEMDTCGNTTPHAYPIGKGRHCVSRDGDLAYIFDDAGNSGGHPHRSLWYEAHFNVTMNYSWYDPNADHNHQVWTAYVDQFTPVNDHWRLRVLPAIQNWEAQVSAFNANYAGWRAEAAIQLQDEQASYEQSYAALTNSRASWTEAMRADYRRGQGDWKKLMTAAAESAATSASAPAAIPVPDAPVNVATNYAFAAGAPAFHTPAAQALVDNTLLDGLEADISAAMRGARQIGVASEFNSRAVAAQEQVIEAYASALQSLGGVNTNDGARDRTLAGFKVEVLANGTLVATREIHSGMAQRTGGDGTDLNDYAAGLETQRVEIAPPPVVRLASSGDLFAEEWDLKDAFEQYSQNQKDFYEDLQKSSDVFQDQMMNAAQKAMVQQQNFMLNRQSAMTIAATEKAQNGAFGNFLKSVGMAMFTGGMDFHTAAAQQANQIAMSTIAESLGVPASIVKGVLNAGLPVHEAFDEYVATDLRNEMISEGAKALGWPETLVRGLADGQDMKTAWKDTTQELVMDEIEKRVDDPAMQALLKQTVQGLRAREDKKAALAEARIFHNEDYATGGFTYVLRELDAQGVSEVGGKTFPVLNSIQSVYRMHREGTPVGGKMLAELAEGALNQSYGMAGLNVDLEVTDRGLSASASIGMPLGMGPTLLSADWQEGRGVTESHVIEGDEWKQFGSKSMVGGLKTTLMDSLSTAMQGPSALIKMLQGDADLHAQLEQGLAVRMEEEAYKSLAASSNLPVSLIKGVVDGADMKQVWKETTDELIIEGVVTEMDCGSKPRDEVQACNMMAANMQQKFRDWRKEQNLREAQKMRSEDYATGGLTMVWRTAQHDEDTALALSVAEMAGGAAAAAFPGVGTAAYMAYTASKQAYGSYQAAEKDERGQAVLAGLLGGAISGATRAYTEGAVDVGLSYSAEEGFGTSVTLGKSYGNLQAGVTLDFNQRKGYTGGSAGVDYKLSENAKLTANAEFSKERGFEGARVGLALNNDSRQQPPATGLSGELGLRINRAGQYDGTYFSGATGGGPAGGTLSGGFDRNGRFTGATLGGRVGNDTVAGRGSLRIGADGEWSQLQLGVQASLMKKAGDEVGQQFSYAPGAGLTLNRNGSFSVSLESAVKWEDSLGAGISELTPTNTTTFSYDANGNFQSASTAARIDSEFRSEEKSREAHLRAQAAQRAQMDPAILADYEAIRDDLRRRYPEMQGDRFEALVQAELLDYAAETGMAADEQADLEKLAALDERYNTESMGAQVELLQRLANEGTIHPDQIGQYLEDPKALHDLLKGKQLTGQLPDYVRTGDTREGLDILTGAFGDAWDFLAGGYSDRNGYIDSDTGQYVVNTCFVAGTPVRVAAGVSGAYRSGGHWYKPIEKIEIGETVLSWNESTGALENRVVTETFVHKTNLIFELRYADGSRVQTTWNHPFYVEGRGWVQVKDLRAGDVSHTRDLIAGRADRDGPMQPARHAAAAGAIAQSSLATLVRPGASEGLAIASIRKIWRDDVVYNIEVEDTHTYFVGARDVLVHNYNLSWREDIIAYNTLGDQGPIKRTVFATVNGKETVVEKTFKKIAENKFVCVENCVDGWEHITLTSEGFRQVLRKSDGTEVLTFFDAKGARRKRVQRDPATGGEVTSRYSSNGIQIGETAVYNLGDSVALNPFNPDSRELDVNSNYGYRPWFSSAFHGGIDVASAAAYYSPVAATVVPDLITRGQSRPYNSRERGIVYNKDNIVSYALAEAYQFKDPFEEMEMTNDPSGLTNSGNMVVLRTNEKFGGINYYMQFMHMPELPEKLSQSAKFEPGEKIGPTGATGLATGPHAHFAVYTIEKPKIDPKYYHKVSDTHYKIHPAYFLKTIASNPDKS